MGNLLESFSVSVRVRTKHAEKNRVGLWDQPAILKAVWDVTMCNYVIVRKKMFLCNFVRLCRTIR